MSAAPRTKAPVSSGACHTGAAFGSTSCTNTGDGDGLGVSEPGVGVRVAGTSDDRVGELLVVLEPELVRRVQLDLSSDLDGVDVAVPVVQIGQIGMHRGGSDELEEPVQAVLRRRAEDHLPPRALLPERRFFCSPAPSYTSM